MGNKIKYKTKIFYLACYKYGNYSKMDLVVATPQFGTFVGNIVQVLKTVKGFGDAEYIDKREVARVLREAVRNGENPVVVASHVVDVQNRN